jgi:uncharacterized membrane protein YdjX (TVP38/TMEM64 family)
MPIFPSVQWRFPVAAGRMRWKLISWLIRKRALPTFGVKVLDEIETPWVKRMLAKLDDRPIRTVILLRIPLSLAPQLSQALALSNVTFRDHLIGSAIGMVPRITLFLLLFDRIILWLRWTGI